MLPHRHLHFVFAIVQSGITTAVAAAITIVRMAPDNPLMDWICSWAVAWRPWCPSLFSRLRVSGKPLRS